MNQLRQITLAQLGRNLFLVCRQYARCGMQCTADCLLHTAEYQPESKFRRTVFVFVAILALCVLAACGLGAAPNQEIAGGGGSTPELVARNFFEDLRDALQDQQLSDEDLRDQWVERLANYFAPNERDDQRVALSSALDNFVSGQGKLDQNESLRVEVRFQDVEKVSDDGNRAMVRPINASIYILITRTTANGFVTLYEDDVPLTKIIGDTNGAVPVIRIGRNWFLTEG